MNTYRKTILFCFICFAAIFANESMAQFNFSPSTLLSVSLPRNSLKYDSIHISNNSNDTLLLSWNLLQYDSIGGTYIDFCSSGDCWLGVPAIGNFSPILPGSFGWAGVHFWTGNQLGSNCTVKIFVYQKYHPENGDTLTYILQTSNTSIIKNFTKNQLCIYPNPVSDKLFINYETNDTKIFTINIMDLSGKILKSVKSDLALTEIPLQNIENGIYFLNIRTKFNIIARKIIVSR